MVDVGESQGRADHDFGFRSLFPSACRNSGFERSCIVLVSGLHPAYRLVSKRPYGPFAHQPAGCLTLGMTKPPNRGVDCPPKRVISRHHVRRQVEPTQANASV
jgi:hypothetical protein